MKNQRWTALGVLGLTLFAAGGSLKSQAGPRGLSFSPPVAAPADVSSPDALVRAVYEVISGPAGQKRDWDRMRSLFYPGARLIRTAPDKDRAGFGATTLTVEDYIDRAGPYLEKNGFFEKEVARKADRWGNIMELFSTYESRHDARDERPFARGINSMQLFYDGTRWWVLTIYWQEEAEATPLPPEFLPHS